MFVLFGGASGVTIERGQRRCGCVCVMHAHLALGDTERGFAAVVRLCVVCMCVFQGGGAAAKLKIIFFHPRFVGRTSLQ